MHLTQTAATFHGSNPASPSPPFGFRIANDMPFAHPQSELPHFNLHPDRSNTKCTGAALLRPSLARSQPSHKSAFSELPNATLNHSNNKTAVDIQ